MSSSNRDKLEQVVERKPEDRLDYGANPPLSAKTVIVRPIAPQGSNSGQKKQPHRKGKKK
jgi:hypothetical protein